MRKADKGVRLFDCKKNPVELLYLGYRANPVSGPPMYTAPALAVVGPRASQPSLFAPLSRVGAV
jgi:hypothetical protein